jgi:hypothetical protein
MRWSSLRNFIPSDPTSAFMGLVQDAMLISLLVAGVAVIPICMIYVIRILGFVLNLGELFFDIDSEDFFDDD